MLVLLAVGVRVVAVVVVVGDGGRCCWWSLRRRFAVVFLLFAQVQIVQNVSTDMILALNATWSVPMCFSFPPLHGRNDMSFPKNHRPRCRW